MKKPGEWIASLSAKLEVSRVSVEANEALDLVEVTEVDRLSGRPSSVRFFDRVEGARMHAALGAALDGLESAAIDNRSTEERGRGVRIRQAEVPPSVHLRRHGAGP